MICYRDMTFCSEKCANLGCPRNYTEDVRFAAEAWWQTFYMPQKPPPVAFSNFKHDKKYCAGYREPN
jgi:hypothetical protein